MSRCGQAGVKVTILMGPQMLPWCFFWVNSRGTCRSEWVGCVCMRSIVEVKEIAQGYGVHSRPNSLNLLSLLHPPSSGTATLQRWGHGAISCSSGKILTLGFGPMPGVGVCYLIKDPCFVFWILLLENFSLSCLLKLYLSWRYTLQYTFSCFYVFFRHFVGHPEYTGLRCPINLNK